MNPSLFEYAVLVAATAGTIVYLFLMVLIVGYRRRRTFERVLFFLALAAFCAYSGRLLLRNSEAFYQVIPKPAHWLSVTLELLGVMLIPALLIHSHCIYAKTIRGRSLPRACRVVCATAYALPVAYLVFGWRTLLSEVSVPNLFTEFDRSSTLIWAIVWIVALSASIGWQLRFSWVNSEGGDARSAQFHRYLALAFGLLGLAVLSFVLSPLPTSQGEAAVLFSGTLLGALLVYVIVRYRSLGTGTQTNLVYGVTAGFLAVLYLAMVRRVSGWLEPYFPPEATSAVLIFVLIGFFEPLLRFANRVLRHSFEKQVEKLQELTKELQREARSGDLPRLKAFAERRIRNEFGLEVVRLSLKATTSGVETPDGGRLDVGAKAPTPEKSGDAVALSHRLGAPQNDWDQGEKDQKDELQRPGWAGQPVRFALGKRGAEIGELIAVPIGSSISGETHAALEFLAEQLPGNIELCCAVEAKTRLERELAERERMALVGQMTASISHNLKNPLGSMKTVLQVQLENPQLDTNIRRDLQMVLSELDRLSAKLNALLRYARPAVRGGEAAKQIEVARVADEVVALMKSEAERRDVSLQIQRPSSCGCINGSEDALNDIFSNLIVNAIEAVEAGGRVVVRLGGDSDHVEIAITDDGPGIPAGQQERLFQPFFTTKTSGTGLGLAIVRRRAAELGGSVDCRSPIAGGRGAEFIVRLLRMKC